MICSACQLKELSQPHFRQLFECLMLFSPQYLILTVVNSDIGDGV